MKANELMIDDWVYNKNIDKPMQVYPMMISQMFRQTPGATTEDYNIFPIPLTKEILEKNGFKSQLLKNHLETVYAYQDVSEAVANDLYALWLHQDGSFYLLLRVNGKDMVRIDVRYVHQLQHALRLCGIKKTIEL